MAAAEACLLVTRRWWVRHGPATEAAARRAGGTLVPVFLPEAPDARLGEEERERLTIALFSGDVYPVYSRSFFAAVQGAPRLQWLHVFNAGVDNPVFGRILAKGVRLSTSSGSTAVPIAQTAVSGMLLLARPWRRWLAAQARRAWEPVPPEEAPLDLEGQTLTVVGLGAIGREIARLGRAFGLRVIGVRRRPRAADDPVDELVHPRDLDRVLPRTQWLALACPLTPETRRLIDARRLALLPRGAFILNVARGEVIDEAALIAALEAGHLGGAYLDVFATEPLPPDSPLWAMPNVFISPHNSAVAQGNEARVAAIFQRNVERWFRGEPLENEARPDDIPA